MDKTRKIIIFSLTRSGCIAYTNELLKSFEKYNPIVYVNELSKSQYDQNYKTLKTYQGYISFIINSIGFFFKSSLLLKSIKHTSKDALIYLPAFHPWNYFLCLNAQRLNIPCVLTVHDYTTHSGERNALVEFIQNKTITYASKVVFLTQHESLKAINDKKIDSSKSIILPHPLYQTQSSNTLKYNSKPNVLFLGRLKDYKVIDLLIDATQPLKINTLTIAGEGKLSYLLKKNVQLINKYLSNDEMMALMDNHEIMVLPYKEASQSGILSLGISKEIVMVITRLPGLLEQVSKTSAIWCEPNKDSLQNALKSVIDNQIIYDKTKKNIAIEKASIKLKWESTFNKMMDTISSL